MSIAVQWRRGTSAEHAAFTGADGEITVNTTNHTLVVHDGTTLGGIPISADVHYTHDQISASATWTVTHNLGKCPSVTVVDSSGAVVIGDIVHDSINQLTITFSGAFSGKAYLN